jgi:hypothetical protein
MLPCLYVAYKRAAGSFRCVWEVPAVHAEGGLVIRG